MFIPNLHHIQTIHFRQFSFEQDSFSFRFKFIFLSRFSFRFKFIFLSEIKIYAKFNFIYLYACQNFIKFEFRSYTKNIFLAFQFQICELTSKKCQIQRQSFLLGTLVSAFLCQILTPYKLLYQILISKTVGPLCSPQFSAYVGLGMMVLLVTSP